MARFDLGPAGRVHLLLFVTNRFYPPHQTAQTPSLLVPEVRKQQACVCSRTIDSPTGRSISAWVMMIYCAAAAHSERTGFPGPSLIATHAPTVTNLHREGEDGVGGRTFLYYVCCKWAKSVCVSFSFPSLFSLVFFLQRMKVLGRPITEREGTRSQCSPRVGKASARSVKSLPRRARKGPH